MTGSVMKRSLASQRGAHWPQRSWAAVLCAVVLLLPGCGDSTDESGGPRSGRSKSSGPGLTDDQIVVGGVAQVEAFPGLDAGVEARFERANRDGGVHGRKLVFNGVEDDGNDSAKNLSIVRSLVQNDDVFAVLPAVSANFLPQSSDFLVQKEVPHIGWGWMPAFCGSEWGYGFNGCLINFEASNPSLVEPSDGLVDKDPSDLKVALQASDDDTGPRSNRLYRTLYEAKGAEIVYDETNMPAAGATTDYSPFVQAIIEADPDIVYVGVTAFADVIGLSGSLKAAGYKGVLVNYVTYVPGLLESQPDVAAALEGVYINVQVPPQEEQTPAIKQIEEDLEAIGEEPFISLGNSLGYWQADLFISMLEAAGPDLTSKSLPELVRSGDYTYEPELDGAVGPMSFPSALDNPTPCAAMVQVVDGKYESAVPFKCYKPDPPD